MLSFPHQRRLAVLRRNYNNCFEQMNHIQTHFPKEDILLSLLFDETFLQWRECLLPTSRELTLFLIQCNTLQLSPTWTGGGAGGGTDGACTYIYFAYSHIITIKSSFYYEMMDLTILPSEVVRKRTIITSWLQDQLRNLYIYIHGGWSNTLY